MLHLHFIAYNLSEQSAANTIAISRISPMKFTISLMLRFVIFHMIVTAKPHILRCLATYFSIENAKFLS